MKLTIKPTRRVHGRFRFPPDNDLAQRTAVLSLLCAGKSTINNWLEDQTTTAALECVRRLGGRVTVEGSVVQIDGKDPADLSSNEAEINCSGAFTSYWLLAGILAGSRSVATLAGDVSPAVQGMVIETLTAMGAVIDGEIEKNEPLKFSPAILSG